MGGGGGGFWGGGGVVFVVGGGGWGGCVVGGWFLSLDVDVCGMRSIEESGASCGSGNGNGCCRADRMCKRARSFVDSNDEKHLAR